MDVTDLTARSGSLEELHREPRFRGQVDVATDGKLLGWALDTFDPTSAVELVVLLDDEPVGEAVTNYDRPDVSAHLRLPLRAGFTFAFSDVASDRVEHVLAKLKEIAGRGEAVERKLSARFKKTGTPLVVGKGLRIGDEELARIVEILTRKQGEIERNFRIVSRGSALEAHPRPESAAADVRFVAFYLPQYHPIPENDEWWGRGFTEWTNVSGAKSYFPGHHQPRRPADLGYYDLRVDAVHQQQVELAKQYGVSAFCYYYYWFSGKRLLDMPVRRHVEQDLDLDFCLCWANENWSRRWDGSEADVLMSQQHSFGDDVRFIEEVLPFFASKRYLKIDGAPLLLVYRISILSDPTEVIARWREIVQKAGFPDLHVCIAETFGIRDPHAYGADSACQFPPHDTMARVINEEIDGVDPKFRGCIYNYRDVVVNEIRRPPPGYLRFRAAMPAWDNTSRKGIDGNLFHNATPELFEAWLTYLAADARKNRSPEHRIVFINAWNEWAEGAYLEPDVASGHDNLIAVRNALSVQNAVAGELFDDEAGLDPDLRRRIADVIATLASANQAITQSIMDLGVEPRLPSSFVSVAPGSILQARAVRDARCWIDQINGIPTKSRHFTVHRDRGLELSGWVEVPGRAFPETWPMFLQLLPLQEDDGPGFVAGIHYRSLRKDVSEALGRHDGEYNFNGFRIDADLAGVPPSSYRMAILVADEGDVRTAVDLQTPFVVHIG